MRTAALWLVTIWFMLALAFANISPPSITEGQTLSPTTEEPYVQMLDEHVKLDLTLERCAVDAMFHMKNFGPTKILEVGYPYQYDGELHKFRAWVDGKPVSVIESQRASGNTMYRQYWPETKWKLWNTTIAQGKTITVRVAYEVSPQRNEPEYDGHEYKHETAFPVWSETLAYDCLTPYMTPYYPEDARPEYWDAHSLVKISRDVASGYILRSGQPWKGRIQRSLIDANWQTLRDWTPEQMYPKDPSLVVKPGESHWDLRNFDPKLDVMIKLRHKITKTQIAAGYKESALQHLRDYHYCAVCCKCLIAFGDMPGAIEVARKSLGLWTAESVVKHHPYSAYGEYTITETGDVEMANFLEQVYGEKKDAANLAIYTALKEKILATFPKELL